jgi:molybdopterin-binding protein
MHNNNKQQATPRAANKQPTIDEHTKWLNKVTGVLAKKTNSNIQVLNKGNNVILSNITEDDLSKLPFVVGTDQSNKIAQISRFEVSVLDSNGNYSDIDIPGLTEMVSNIYNESAAQSFLAGSLTHSPFSSATSTSKAISSSTSKIRPLVDAMTNANPTLQKTGGKKVLYKIKHGPTSLGYDSLANNVRSGLQTAPNGYTCPRQNACATGTTTNLFGNHNRVWLTPNGGEFVIQYSI